MKNSRKTYVVFLVAFTVALLLMATAAYAQGATSRGGAATSLPTEVFDKLPKAGGNGTIVQSGSGTGSQGIAVGSGGQAVKPVIDEKSIYRLPPESASSGPTNPNINGVTGVAPGVASASSISAPRGGSESGGSSEAEQGQPVLGEPSTALPSEVVPAASTKPDVKSAVPQDLKQNEQQQVQKEQKSLTARISGFFKRLFRR